MFSLSQVTNGNNNMPAFPLICKRDNDDVFASFQTYLIKLFVLTLVLILVLGMNKKLFIRLFTRQDRDESEERKRWMVARTHRLSLQMRASQTDKKAV